jgi:bacillithiol biosynthesis deacetylase BshB1
VSPFYAAHRHRAHISDKTQSSISSRKIQSETIMPINILFFGSHPDDVEWGVGGIALLLRKRAVSFAVIDLTRGELGSRGTLEERSHEATQAAEFMGAQSRENLALPDGGLLDTPANRLLIARSIRQHRPQIVVAPLWEDRHPDHAAAGLMVRNSALYCTLRKTDDPNPPHLPAAFLYYPLHKTIQPTFVTDITPVYPRKLELLRLHHSQFGKTAEQHGVIPQGLGDYLHTLETRDRHLGSHIGVHFGEALIADRPLKLNSIEDLL